MLQERVLSYFFLACCLGYLHGIGLIHSTYTTCCSRFLLVWLTGGKPAHLYLPLDDHLMATDPLFLPILHLTSLLSNSPHDPNLLLFVLAKWTLQPTAPEAPQPPALMTTTQKEETSLPLSFSASKCFNTIPAPTDVPMVPPTHQ